jgi:hypothetical protein
MEADEPVYLRCLCHTTLVISWSSGLVAVAT